MGFSKCTYFVAGICLGAFVIWNVSQVQSIGDASALLNQSLLMDTDTVIVASNDAVKDAAPDVTGKKYDKYVPGGIEQFIMDNLEKLGFHKDDNPSGCKLLLDPKASSPAVHADLTSYGADVDAHTKAIANFQEIPDLMNSIKKTNSHAVCSTARPHPDGIEALFPSNQLSQTKSGYVEPLTTPMRSHRFCNTKEALMSLDYLVHDFEEMCLKLKPTSKRVLIDMGASLSFHGSDQPIVTLLKLYKKFGFHFDHIYGFEITFSEPKKVFEELLPQEYLPTYHWINTGVDPTKGAKLNPLHSILKQFDEDDFIVIKLDVDTHSVEMPLAQELLEDEDGIYSKLVDQFYFEHHVHMKEISKYWKSSMEGSLKDSFDLFYGLRQKGIPSHFWP
eukprot:CAMPEP_0197237494 /NCGR_PEP_ID=MMETSP1429-20130617/4304_1 /TAXON_ID=49237 /ORGANISM="Chaetoceros  sp., Strain UNC1202" /LENGTH=389 /DNA_ID=CAMNT_0042696503 /DNA_START=1 /DNA_END=1170 /DNA_ORIENTATION=+